MENLTLHITLHQPESSSRQQGQRRNYLSFSLYLPISAGARRLVYWVIDLFMKAKGESKRICQNPHTFGLQLHFLLKISFLTLTSPDLPVFLDWINFIFTKGLSFRHSFGWNSWYSFDQLDPASCKFVTTQHLRKMYASPSFSHHNPWYKPSAKKDVEVKSYVLLW